MTQGRLVNLAIMNIESDILREIDFTAIVITAIITGTWYLTDYTYHYYH